MSDDANLVRRIERVTSGIEPRLTERDIDYVVQGTHRKVRQKVRDKARRRVVVRAGVAGGAFWGPPDRIEPPERLDVTGFSWWLVVIAVLFEWEAAGFRDNSPWWHPSLTELVNRLSTSGDRLPNLPAFSGLTMSQLSVIWRPVLVPPWTMIPCARRMLIPRSKPFQ